MTADCPVDSAQTNFNLSIPTKSPTKGFAKR